MLIAAYLLFVLIVSVARAETPATRRSRVVAAALATVLAAAAAARLGVVLREDAGVLARIVPAAVAVGGVVYATACRSTSGAALAVRRAAWVLMVAALAIPSTFSLALPLVAPLVAINRRRGARSRPSPQPSTR